MGRLARYTLAQIMGLVALVAVAFAVAPAPLAIALSLLVLAIAVFSRVLATPWSRLAAWVFACYPLLFLASLYTTWLAAWYALGHRPRPSVDDPKFIGPLVSAPHHATWILITGFVPALLVCLLLIALEITLTLRREPNRVSKIMASLAIPALSWPLTFAIIEMDPGLVLYWFFD